MVQKKQDFIISRKNNEKHGFGLLIKKDVSRYFGFFKEGNMNGRFYSRNLQGEVFKQMYVSGSLIKEERERKFNNFFEILKLEHLDYKNLFDSARLFQRDSQSNFDNMSLQRKISLQHRISYKSVKEEKVHKFFTNMQASSKAQSMNTLETPQPQRRPRKSSLVLDKVFLEDQETDMLAELDVIWSPSDDEDSKAVDGSVKRGCSKSGSKKQEMRRQKQKNEGFSVTVKRVFFEDCHDNYSFHEKKTKKDFEFSQEQHFEYNESQSNHKSNFKTNFRFFEEKFSKKYKNNKESFFKNLFSGFLEKKNDKCANEGGNQFSSEGSGVLNDDDDDSDGISDSDEPPNLKGTSHLPIESTEKKETENQVEFKYQTKT